MKIYLVDSFVRKYKGGNPAGVVLEPDSLSVEDMQIIAKRVGLSEVIFIKKLNGNKFKARFFTPVSEVDLCGHATIAAYSLLKDQGIIDNGVYLLQTNVGDIQVEIKNDVAYMSQMLPTFFQISADLEIAESLNILVEDFLSDLPIQIVSTGLKDVIIPIKNLDMLYSIKPNYRWISKICQRYGVVGFHLFSLNQQCSTAICRNFAPLYGINEEAATGTSNGALACYLFTHGAISEKNMHEIVFWQGESMGKPSELLVKLTADENEIKQVMVGGRAIVKGIFTNF